MFLYLINLWNEQTYFPQVSVQHCFILNNECTNFYMYILKEINTFTMLMKSLYMKISTKLNAGCVSQTRSIQANLSYSIHGMSVYLIINVKLGLHEKNHLGLTAKISWSAKF